MLNGKPRVLLLAHDSVDPENHGYRIDVGRRLRKLEQMGFEVGLITLSRESSDCELHDSSSGIGLRRSFFRSDYVPGLVALLNNPRTPWPAVARSLRASRYRPLVEQIRKFAPRSVVVEGLYSFQLTKNLCSDVLRGVPIMYRSHNVEHAYMRGQLRAAKDAKTRLNLTLCVNGLKRFEYSAIAASNEILDISWEDAEFWRERLFRDVHWIPPIGAPLAAPLRRDKRWDFAYCGNLNAPNNVEAIKWFIGEVWPEYLRRCDPNARLVVAGSRPTFAVQQICTSLRGIVLLPNPPSMQEVYSGSGVLINPALSGSGVNIKTVDMIFSGRPLVVSRAAIRGLPPFVVSALGVATTTSEWIAAMERAASALPNAAQRLATEYTEATELAYKNLSNMLRGQ